MITPQLPQSKLILEIMRRHGVDEDRLRVKVKLSDDRSVMRGLNDAAKSKAVVRDLLDHARALETGT